MNIHKMNVHAAEFVPRVAPKINLKENRNYLFYTNRISSQPDGDFIDQIHANWFGDYKRLERHHGFIQWLFPLRERGVNYDSDPLNEHEIELMRDDARARERMVESYKLMLDFYGLRLIDEETGSLEHTEMWTERYSNMNRNTHNSLRICRIIKCLEIFNFHNLSESLVRFLAMEILVHNRLSACKKSCTDFWMTSIPEEQMEDILQAIEIETKNSQKQREKTKTADNFDDSDSKTKSDGMLRDGVDEPRGWQYNSGTVIGSSQSREEKRRNRCPPGLESGDVLVDIEGPLLANGEGHVGDVDMHDTSSDHPIQSDLDQHQHRETSASPRSYVHSGYELSSTDRSTKNQSPLVELKDPQDEHDASGSETTALVDSNPILDKDASLEDKLSTSLTLASLED